VSNAFFTQTTISYDVFKDLRTMRCVKAAQGFEGNR
jgi:hypothetical protein